MAEENQDGQEKTEEPSQRKIDKHKEDGKVLSSKEMFVFTGIAGALLLMYAFSFAFKPNLFSILLRKLAFEWYLWNALSLKLRISNAFKCSVDNGTVS